jgi:cytoskeletal protein CcmA (bactofilin family)
MKKIFSFSIYFLLLAVFASNLISSVNAATIRSDDTVIISNTEKNLSDLYLFGGTIVVDAPVANDIVAAGGDIDLNDSISGSILAAGGTLRFKGSSQGSARIAGGTVLVEGDIARDLIVAGGSVIIAKSAAIGGDLIVTGGNISIDGQIRGKTIINSGEVAINGDIGKQVEANVGKLSLGENARIGSDLKYSSPRQAEISEGARINGEQKYTPVEDHQRLAKQAGSFFTAFSFYKLTIDIIISLILIRLFGRFLNIVLKTSSTSPITSAAFGFAFIFLIPILSLFLLILLWMGVALFLIYSLIIIASAFIAKITLGWLIISWWHRRGKREYLLDWRAAVLGPVALYIIAIIPFLGWLFLAILYLISAGSITRSIALVSRSPKPNTRKK